MENNPKSTEQMENNMVSKGVTCTGLKTITIHS